MTGAVHQQHGALGTVNGAETLLRTLVLSRCSYRHHQQRECCTCQLPSYTLSWSSSSCGGFYRDMQFFFFCES